VPEPQFAFVDELPPRPQVIQFLSKLPGLEELLPTVRVRRLNWEKAVERNEENRALALARHNQAREEWQRLRQTAEQDQNIQADTRRRQYLAKDFSTLIEYWTNVLARSEYPISSRGQACLTISLAIKAWSLLTSYRDHMFASSGRSPVHRGPECTGGSPGFRRMAEARL